MARTLCTALIVLVFVCALQAAAPAAEVGINLASHDGGDVNTLAQTQSAYARIFLWWPSVEPVDGQVDETTLAIYRHTAERLRAQGTRMVLTIVGTPAWASVDGIAGGAPKHPARYGAFAARVATAMGDTVAAYEVWNEEDIDGFWRNPDPTAYARLLRAAYPALKRAAPHATVLFGPLTGGDYTFFDAALRAGARGSFDAVGVHTDIPCELRSPEQYVRDPNGMISRWSFLGYRSLHQTMVRHGIDAPLWMTELGWATADEPCPTGRWAGMNPAGVSEEAQARFLRLAYGCLVQDRYVQVALWFTLRDDADVLGVLRYGVLRADGSPKPAWDAYRAVAADPGGARRTGCRPHYVGPHIALSGGRRVTIRVRAELGIERVTIRLDGRGRRLLVKDAPPYLRLTRTVPQGCHLVEVRALDVAHNAASARRRACSLRRGPGG